MSVSFVELNDNILHDMGKLPPETCATIDSIIKYVTAANKLAAKAERNRDYGDNERSDFDSITTELFGVVENLEEVRKANMALRDAAKGWKGRAYELAETLDAKMVEIEELHAAIAKATGDSERSGQ